MTYRRPSDRATDAALWLMWVAFCLALWAVLWVGVTR